MAEKKTLVIVPGYFSSDVVSRVFASENLARSFAEEYINMFAQQGAKVFLVSDFEAISVEGEKKT